MDVREAQRVRELLNLMNNKSNVHYGVSVSQGAVVARYEGAPYSESPLPEFSPTDVQNAVDESLLQKREVRDYYTKELLYEMYVSCEVVHRDFVANSPVSSWQAPKNGQVISEIHGDVGGHVCLTKSGFNVWRKDRLTPIHYPHDAETLARYRFFVPQPPL